MPEHRAIYEPAREMRKHKRYLVEYNAASYMLELERFLVNNRVDILYDVRVAGVQRQRNSLDAVIIESKSGREAITCRAAVDATGDADVCHLAGERTVSLKTNTAAGWYYTAGTAAAMSGNSQAVQIEDLQERLLRQNVKLWMKQIEESDER